MTSEPTREQVTAANIAYHDALAASYDERLELYHPKVIAYLERLLHMHVFAELPANARVLDLGCGTGYMEQFLEGRFESVTAVDASEGMLARARAKHPRVSYVCADLYAFALEPASYDLVVAHALLHHLKDYEVVLARMTQAVKPGGVLFLGYEPDSVVFRSVGILRTLYRRIFSESRVGAVNAALGTAELEALAEYHQFYGRGLPARALARRLASQGFAVRLFHPGISFLAQLQDRSGIPFPRFLPSLPFVATNFHLVARRTAEGRS